MAEVQQQKIAALEKKVGTGGKSPLFAQLASFYLQRGKAKEALKLCDDGLAVFPHYTTGHLVKGKVLLALKMNAEARREFEIVQEFLPANETVAFILSNIQPGDGETLTASPPEPVASEPVTAGQPVAPEIAEAVAPEEPLQEAPSGSAPGEESMIVPAGDESAASANVTESVAEPPQDADDVFGFGSGAVQPPVEAVPVEADRNPFEGFPSQPEPEVAAEGGPILEKQEAENTFDIPVQPPEAPVVTRGEETFETYAARIRQELGGGENTMSLDEYLGSAENDQALPHQDSPGTSGETIENLAEKLQSAKKITPVINLATKATIPMSEADTPASTGFVTPTLAEIYAKQGWYDDAIKAYRTLTITKPAERERFEKRIAELEELKKQQK
ncbi:MAG TPA: hypothetical protein VI758_04660 [Bacteroidota bacterium]